MAFASLRLKSESGANRIKSADDAYSFVAHMRLSYQNKPHWQIAKQTLNHAGSSDASEILAWRPFRAAVEAKTGFWNRESPDSSSPLRLQPICNYLGPIMLIGHV